VFRTQYYEEMTMSFNGVADSFKSKTRKGKGAIPFIFFLLISGYSFHPAYCNEIEKGKEQQAISSIETKKEKDKYIKKNINHSSIIFDDQKLLDGYKKKYNALSKNILLEMIKDENLDSYKVAAAVMVFNDKFIQEIVSKEKKKVEKILLRALGRTDSPFVQVEIMYTLCRLDRYRYFRSMIPALLQKLNHYNSTVNDIAFSSIEDIIEQGNDRPREARIVFNTLRKILFLSRRRLANIDDPNLNLSRKLVLVRWSIKVLGTQSIRRLPEEVFHLL